MRVAAGAGCARSFNSRISLILRGFMELAIPGRCRVRVAAGVGCARSLNSRISLILRGFMELAIPRRSRVGAEAVPARCRVAGCGGCRVCQVP